ncbi:MAG: hypothetical protein U0869_25395 [Chloroflexota bacterium]
MITITCPWCEGDAPLETAQLEDAGGRFSCPTCLTTVELVDETPEAMPIAA